MDHTAFKQIIDPILPASPGVYRFIGEDQDILYVGKAKNLRNRVSSYFNKSNQHSARIRLLVKKATNIQFTVVESEHDALLLENSFIKKYQPRYNINLKDDKSYPYIVIKNERFPRLYLTRNKVDDGSEYLGPFTSVARVRTILEFLRSLYPIRTCSYNLSEENIQSGKFRVCLEYHLGNCLGPCEGLQSEESYQHSIDQIRNILRGKATVVIQGLKQQMLEHADRFEFEEAEALKKKIHNLESYQSRSTVVSPKVDEVDVIDFVEANKRAFVTYFKVVEGTIIQTHAAQLKKQLDESKADLLNYAILFMRDKFQSTSHEVIVPFEPDYTFPDITITVPQRGDKKKLLDLARKNALEYKNRILTKVDKHRMKTSRSERVLKQLQHDFRMTELPTHIECFDNSNIQGTTPVASAVVFKDAKPSKKEYRHFNIKTVQGPNDFASMEEIVYRRYRRLLEEEAPLPQLILIDGGKGQLNAALKSLVRLGIESKVTLAAIAKRLEEIYFPHDPVPLHIHKASESLKLLQQIRNEAHRFAITFHRSKRQKGSLKTELTQINGIGKTSAEALLKKFRSVKKVKQAGLDELSEIIGLKRAKLIKTHFKK